MEARDSKEYFERRAAEERDAADRALDARAAESHRELARRYGEKAVSASAEPPEAV